MVATTESRPSIYFSVIKTLVRLITVRLVYLNSYGCKEDYIYILRLSRPDVLMDENYYF